MPLTTTLLPEFENEMASTRRLLERTPAADSAWVPHAKSAPLGQLAMHIATLPEWLALTLEQPELDLAPPGGSPYQVPAFESTAALLQTFDASVARAREAITRHADTDMSVPWTLKAGGHVVFTLPRGAVLRSFVMNHLIHHRGQYSVYLRLRDVPLPSTYGPTADTEAEAAASAAAARASAAQAGEDSLKHHGDALADRSGSR